jgi:carboxyl-terminal processing protease
MKFILLALALFPALTFAEKRTPEEYWSRTDLTTEAVYRSLGILDTKSCGSNEKTYLGCVAAINAVAAMAEPPMQLVSKKMLGNAKAGIGEEVENFDSVSLVKILPDAANDQESLRNVFLRQDTKRKLLRAEILALRKMQIDFPKIFSRAVSLSVKDASKDAIAAGAAVSAFLSEAVDAHARIEPFEQLQDSLNDADQSFTGIGATLQELNKKILVQSPMEGSPALKAGIKPNDIIIAIDGKLAANRKLSDVVKDIRGPQGSQVVIRVLRSGKEIDISITRQKIELPNVEAKIVRDFSDPVGVIRLRSFKDKQACAEIAEKIEWLEAQKVKGLVLDLRGNGGGLLAESVCIGGLFVGQKVIVKVKSLESYEFQEQKSWEMQKTDLPLVTLIDDSSASASEVLSGALQDHQRSWIVGERSFGKGTVQAPRRFYNDKIIMYRTIQRFYQPSGRTNQMVGITPDIEVFAKPNITEEEKFRLREADIYPNGLEAVGPVWKQTRVKEVKLLQDCLAKENLAKEKAVQAEKLEQAADYPMLTAQEVLRCQR